MKVEVLRADLTRGTRKILDISNLTFESGKIYALIGPNGAGKTSLLRSIAGIKHDPYSRILYDGSEALPRDRIAYLTQNVYLFDTTVKKNTILGIEHQGLSQDEMDIEVKEALKKVGMENFLESKSRFLSGGEAQRVAVARILIMKKDLVLMDEPSSATDIAGSELIEDYIKEVNEKEGRTFIFSTHNPSQAQRIAHEIIFLNSGKVTEMGTPEKVLNNPDHEETVKFLKNWRI